MSDNAPIFSDDKLQKSVEAAAAAHDASAGTSTAKSASLDWNISPEAGELDLGVQKDGPKASWSLTGWIRRKWSGPDKTDYGVKGGVKW